MRKSLNVLAVVSAGLLAVTASICSGVLAQERVLRTHFTADPAMIDPITYSELFAGDVIGNMYEGFAAIDRDGNVIPALAESWEAHDDNLGFRFHLRRDVSFHSGRQFGAKDVKWTFEQILIPGNKGGLTQRYLNGIIGAEAVKTGETTDLVGITVVDEHTLDVRFTEPEVLFPIFPFYFMDSGIVAEHGPDWMRSVSAGTGPFQFKRWRRGQEVRLSAFNGYWGDGPHIDQVVYLIVPDESTAVAMYEADELDLLYIGQVAGRRVLKDPRFADELLLVPAAQIRYLGMNQSLYPPFRDIRVREAICLAFDRDAMVEGLQGGAGFPLYGQITPGVAGYNPDIPPILYEPERARALLAEAGYPEGQGLPPIVVTGTAPNRATLAYLANQLKTVLGMPTSVEIVERGIHIKAMNAGEVAFFPWGWTAGYPDALYFLSQVWYGPSPYNRSRWQNDAFDALIEQAQAEPDEQMRYGLYHRAEAVLMQDWGTCPTVIRMQIAVKKPNVSDVFLTPFRFLPFNAVRMDG